MTVNRPRKGMSEYSFIPISELMFRLWIRRRFEIGETVIIDGNEKVISEVVFSIGAPPNVEMTYRVVGEDVCVYPECDIRKLNESEK